MTYIDILKVSLYISKFPFISYLLQKQFICNAKIQIKNLTFNHFADCVNLIVNRFLNIICQ
jgi:hypothetical protein